MVVFWQSFLSNSVASELKSCIITFSFLIFLLVATTQIFSIIQSGFKNQLYIKLGYLPVLLASSGSQWSKSRNKEMKTREGDHVDGQLPQISIKLTRETQTSGHTCKSNT